MNTTYEKNLNKLLNKAPFMDKIDESNILWWERFWLYNNRYYITNLIWGVAEVSQRVYKNIY